MTYKKGKDIKIPFDCLWYYFTRKFEANNISKIGNYEYDRPRDFDKW